MSDQAELAKRLLEEMAVAGDDEEGGISVLSLLDDLACAGLRLVPDQEGIASRAYFELLLRDSEQPEEADPAKLAALVGHQPLRIPRSLSRGREGPGEIVKGLLSRGLLPSDGQLFEAGELLAYQAFNNGEGMTWVTDDDFVLLLAARGANDSLAAVLDALIEREGSEAAPEP